MSGKNISIMLCLLLLLFLTGCVATPDKRIDSRIAPLEEQVSLLNARLMARDSEIDNLNRILGEESEEKGKLLEIISEQESQIKKLTSYMESRKGREKNNVYYSSVINIQAALRNAGFDPGLIDGRMGERTRSALKEFQQARNLPADGRLNKETWTLLQEYLEEEK